MQKSNLCWLWLAAFVFVLDQFTKAWVSHTLFFGESKAIFPFLSITLVHNQGAAFSFLNNAGGWQQWLFGGIAFVICVGICLWLSRMKKSQPWLSAALALVLGGALGNLIDRISHQYVIDFIDFHVGQWHWPIFNIADSAIVIGICMLFFTGREKGDR